MIVTFYIMIVVLMHVIRNKRWGWLLSLFFIPFAWVVYYFVHYRKDAQCSFLWLKEDLPIKKNKKRRSRNKKGRLG
ncbi:hypothetical protein KY313_03400 [Candidatus Woesearchaeota archaeon]|nr:hypothetical protein [Candidatus Woesearchaeota archaeon]